jgi:hypothetical protein
MAFKGRNPEGQRKMFFMRLKSSIASVPARIHELEERHRRAHLQRMQLEAEEIDAETQRLKAEISARKLDEEAKARAAKARKDLAKLKSIEFEHSRTGRLLASGKRGAGALFKIIQKASR